RPLPTRHGSKDHGALGQGLPIVRDLAGDLAQRRAVEVLTTAGQEQGWSDGEEQPERNVAKHRDASGVGAKGIGRIATMGPGAAGPDRSLLDHRRMSSSTVQSTFERTRAATADVRDIEHVAANPGRDGGG